MTVSFGKMTVTFWRFSVLQVIFNVTHLIKLNGAALPSYVWCNIFPAQMLKYQY